MIEVEGAWVPEYVNPDHVVTAGPFVSGAGEVLGGTVLRLIDGTIRRSNACVADVVAMIDGVAPDRGKPAPTPIPSACEDKNGSTLW